MGIGLLLQFPQLPSPSNTPIFPLVSWSCWVLHGSVYSFPLVRYSCPLSAGVLHAVLHLKMYSWCIHGERCTPHPPIPLPSCSLLIISSLRQTFLTCLMLCLVLCWSFCNRLFLMHVASPWIFWRTLKLILKLPFVSYYDLVWRRKWQPTPVSLPGKFHGWRSLVGYIPLGCKESDTAEWLHCV